MIRILATIAICTGAVHVCTAESGAPPLPGSSTTVVTGYRGRIEVTPDQPPVKKVPRKTILDPERLSPDVLFKFETTPEISTNVMMWGEAFHLQESISYLTGLPNSKIPPTMEPLCHWLPTQGFRIVRLKKLQAKAAQVLVANGFYILVKARVRKEDQPAAPHFNVIKGYVVTRSPKKGIASLPGEKPVFFCLMDNKGFYIKERQFLRWHDRSMAATVNERYRTFNRLYKTWIYIEDIYAVVPNSFQSKDIMRFIKSTMEEVNLTFKAPQIVDLTGQ